MVKLKCVSKNGLQSITCKIEMAYIKHVVKVASQLISCAITINTMDILYNNPYMREGYY